MDPAMARALGLFISVWSIAQTDPDHLIDKGFSKEVEERAQEFTDFILPAPVEDVD